MRRLKFILLGFTFSVLIGLAVVRDWKRELPVPAASVNAISALKKGAPARPGQPQSARGGSGSESVAITITPADKAQDELARQVLASKNDNDPRLDTELKVLGPGAKLLLKERYSRFSLERRNERGTIVFLLGRNLASESDFDFLKEVLEEPPCRSLENCEREAGGSVAEGEHHHDAGSEVTLAYPQLVALKAMESYLFSDNADPRLVSAALRNLDLARRSPVGKVARLADEIHGRYHGRN